MMDNLRRVRAAQSIKSKSIEKITPQRRAVKKSDAARELTHQCALKILEHMGRHGDIRLAARFLKEQPDYHDRHAIMTWFFKFGPISASDKPGTLSFVRGKPTRIGAAMRMPYWRLLPRRRSKVL
jgi:hypothetical protein